MKEWKLTVSPLAFDDMRGIHDYIAEQLLEPDVADALLSRIITGIESLRNMPLRFAEYVSVPLRRSGIRSMPIDNYLVFFLPNAEKNEVVVMRIIYSRRNIKDLL